VIWWLPSFHLQNEFGLLRSQSLPLLRACQAIGEHLRPFLPDAATRITRQCATDATGLLPGPAPILPRIAEPVPAERRAARRGIRVN
jgi:hypothetical protein